MSSIVTRPTNRATRSIGRQCRYSMWAQRTVRAPMKKTIGISTSAAQSIGSAEPPKQAGQARGDVLALMQLAHLVEQAGVLGRDEVQDVCGGMPDRPARTDAEGEWNQPLPEAAGIGLPSPPPAWHPCGDDHCHAMPCARPSGNRPPGVPDATTPRRPDRSAIHAAGETATGTPVIPAAHGSMKAHRAEKGRQGRKDPAARTGRARRFPLLHRAQLPSGSRCGS